MVRLLFLVAMSVLCLLAGCGQQEGEEAGNPMELGSDPQREQCVLNMYEICIAQSMHYGIYNVYMTSMPEVYEFMGEELVCPTCGQYYLLHSDGQDHYMVTCPLTSEPNHGSFGTENPPPPPQKSGIEQCRSNMLSISTAQAMYYGIHNSYADSWSELWEVGSVDSLCPVCGQTYAMHAADTTYTLICPCPSEPEHGSVVDGIRSWL